MKRIISVLAALTVAAISLTGCVSPGLDRRVDDLSRRNDGLLKQNQSLESRIASLEAEEASLRQELDKAQKTPAKSTAPEITISDELKGKGVKVRTRGNESVIEMPSEVFFGSGSAKLSDAGEKAMATVADALKKLGTKSMIRVEGHSDSDPLKRNKEKYHCNWELSFERAHAVLHYLIDKAGFDPHHLAADCYGEFQPQDPGDKSKNRRVEIVVSR